MNQKEFEQVLAELSERRKEVLQKVLNREKNDEIAKSLTITPATVRKHVEEICDKFGIPRGTSGKRYPRRNDLIALFAKYKPELFQGDTLEVLPSPKVDVEETKSDNSDFMGGESAIADSTLEDIETLVQNVRKHPQHRDKIQDQCGTMRMLDIARPTEIDNIYIHLNVLEELPSNRHDLEIADFQGFSSTRDNFDRLGLGNVREPQVPGLEAVARYSKLMVLGKPGAGKTTFLKFLAIQCNQGRFQHERIPMFIELKVFARKARKQDDFSLLKYVKKELCICEISEPQIEKMLHQGRFLILLDGLDEVKADDGEKVLTEVYDFSREYFKNQFVITCRIAALLANQRYKLGFTDVEVADFTSKQIEEFAQKWFVAVARNSQKKGLATANQFIEKLNLPENEQIRELAVTPILLNLTCLVFQGRRNFPSKRSKLYEQGLEILLKRWDESRGIKRDEVYRNLSLPQKIHLLSHVAAISFEQGNTFLKKVKSSNLLPTISVPYLWLQLTRINCRWIVK